MTKLLYFTRTQERETESRKEGVSLSWNGGEGELYSCSGKNMNEMSFNESCQMIKRNHKPTTYFKFWRKLVH